MALTEWELFTAATGRLSHALPWCKAIYHIGFRRREDSEVAIPLRVFAK